MATMTDSYVNTEAMLEAVYPEAENEEELDDDEKSLTQGVKPWDEGGISDCGYSDLLHSALMGIGGSIHSVIGDPSSETRQIQTVIGNWFQELSYAARDIVRGDHSGEMKKDAADAVTELLNSGHDVLKATGSTLSSGVIKSNPSASAAA
jgi:uncharacterized protein YacL (UPF0231 family)